jgi:hypothetical protein
MSLENFKKIILLAKKDGYQTIKLLGGEPTIHPEFPEMINFLIKTNTTVTLISNLLYTDKAIRDCIYQAVQNGIISGVLANAAELNDTKSLYIFKQNYSAILESSVKQGQAKITAGITLSRDKSAGEEIAYLEFLAQNIPISKLRLSLDFQSKNSIDTFFINNKDYGQKILAIIYKCLDLRIPMSWDCKIYPCMFEKAVFQKDIEGFVQQLYAVCPAESAPFDVFPDMTYIHCYPAQSLSGKNILKFSRLSEAFGEITFLKKTLQASLKNNLPKNCFSCDYYKTNYCDSLCLGCRELAASFLQPTSL